MGSRVNVCSATILDNPASFSSEFKLEITFEAFERLPHDLEWELVYVGSGESTEYDQILDSVLVGPTEEGKHKFLFTTPGANPEKVPEADIVGVSVLLLKCRYNNQEFLNLGWFVSNEYTDEELKANPPTKPVVEKLTRTVQIDDLRVTSFPIKWDENETEEIPAQEEEMVDEADLMPLEDPDVDDEEDEEDKEVADDIDLEESMEDVDPVDEPMAAEDSTEAVKDSTETTEATEGTEATSEGSSGTGNRENDVDMETKDSGDKMDEIKEGTTPSPLEDVTNDATTTA